MVSIDEIEKKTGLDFYSILDDDIESELEKNVSGEIWPKPSMDSEENISDKDLVPVLSLWNTIY